MRRYGHDLTGRTRRCQRQPRIAMSVTLQASITRSQGSDAVAMMSSARPGPRCAARTTSPRPRRRCRAAAEISLARSFTADGPAAGRVTGRAGPAGRRRARPLAGGQLRRAAHLQPVEEEAADDAQRREPVDDAAAEADRARLVEVARRHRDLVDPAAQPGRHDLGDQLLVEHEVVAVEAVRDRLEQVPAVGPQARVVLRQVEAEGRVLEAGQEAVADRTSTWACRRRAGRPGSGCRASGPPRPSRIGRDQRRDPGRVVLVVGVEHHDDVGAAAPGPRRSRSSGCRRSPGSGGGR